MTLRAIVLGHSTERFESTLDADAFVRSLREVELNPPELERGMSVQKISISGYDLSLTLEYGRGMQMEFVGRVEPNGALSALVGRIGPPISELGFWFLTMTAVFLLYALLGEPLSIRVMLGSAAIILVVNRLMPNGPPREAIRSLLRDAAIAAV